MSTHEPWLCIPAAIIALPATAQATAYLSVEQAQQLMFPGASFTATPLRLSDAQLQAVEKQCGVHSARTDVLAWRVSNGGYFLVDAVIGKHDLITFALGIRADGSIEDVEIIEYRESYGGEVRNAAWRRQFVHKTAADPLRLDEDIRNISGATLSSKHVTDAVRRLMAIHAVALR